MLAVVELRHLSEMAKALMHSDAFSMECSSFADEVEAAIMRYAVADHTSFGKVFAYEIDGFGNRIFMDDANVPNLLSIPYLGFRPLSDPIAANTRRFVLSDANPYFAKGKAAEGIGSPHTGRRSIWPIGLTMQALTSSSDDEIAKCVSTIKRTHAGTGFMHESFDPDDPTKFTRKWFAWANTLFGELIVKVAAERPRLLERSF
jgi:meiotically up-regulated gene 157 (Mug157) protein